MLGPILTQRQSLHNDNHNRRVRFTNEPPYHRRLHKVIRIQLIINMTITSMIMTTIPITIIGDNRRRQLPMPHRALRLHHTPILLVLQATLQIEIGRLVTTKATEFVSVRFCKTKFTME